MRYIDADDNIKQSEQLIKKDKFKHLDELIRVQQENQDS